MNLSLRAKFLILSAVVQAMVVGLLIWNSLRLMDEAVRRNAARVAHEYAVTLNLSLSPYATSGRLPEMRAYMAEMLSDPRDTFVRYVLILDPQGQPLLQVGSAPAAARALFRGPAKPGADGLRTEPDGAVLHARAPLLLMNNQIGALQFGVSTEDLALARNDVLIQGTVISAGGFVFGLMLYYAFTAGIGRRLEVLTRQSMRLAHGQFEETLPEHGGDELEVFAHSLNTMSGALRERIDQLEHAEQRLRESEARFKILFDTAPVPLTVTDRSGILLATNQALTRIFGHEREAVLGKRTSEIGFWADPDERQRIWDIFQRDGMVQGEVAKVKLQDGREGDVAIWSSTLVLAGEGSIVWALLDLTEELQAKRSLKELNTSLETRVKDRSSALERANGELSQALETLKRTQHDLISSEKMASLGSLVAGIAHELNTPIGNSLLAATTLSDRVAQFQSVLEDGNLKRSILNEHLTDVALASSLISGSLNKAANLIASFKQVAVDQTNDQRRVFDLRNVLEDTLATFSPRLRRANCISRVEVKGNISLNSYPGSLCQVVSNLITNALVHAFDQSSSATITVTAQETMGGEVCVVFTDDGAGMPPEVLHHVFDPFFTTKMGQGGTGLGMNIVYNIVTGVLGGRIGINTVLGQGTSVSMTLPKSAPQREVRKTLDAPGGTAPARAHGASAIDQAGAS
ncbi:MAG: ATP-binding protein [Pseudomonadota bacterium]